jgi:hypothetical protein
MDITIVTKAVKELRVYARFCHKMAFILEDGELERQEKETVGQIVASITKQLCDVISKRGFEWTFKESAVFKYNQDRSIYEGGQSPPSPTWTNISPYDWNVILVSILNNLGIENFHGVVREGLQGLERVKQFGTFFSPRDQEALRRLVVDISSGIESKKLAELLSALDWDDLGKLLRDTLERFICTQEGNHEALVNELIRAQSIDTINDLISADDELSQQPMVLPSCPTSTSTPIARGDAAVPHSTTSPSPSFGSAMKVAAHPVLNSTVTFESSQAPSFQCAGFSTLDGGTAASPIEVDDSVTEWHKQRLARSKKKKRSLGVDDLHATSSARVRKLRKKWMKPPPSTPPGTSTEDN